MRKALIAAVLLMLSVSLFVYGNPASNRNVIEIRERMFMTQINDVYINSEDYLGKTIKLEGILLGGQNYVWEDGFHAVVRYGPGGCCGNDGMVGFEVKWPAGRTERYPANDSWVEATGVLKVSRGDYNNEYLYLELTSLNVLNRRGAENVRQ